MSDKPPLPDMQGNLATIPMYWQWIVGAITLPFIVTVTFLETTRRLPGYEYLWDYAGLGVAILSGIYFIWRLPAKLWGKIALTVLAIAGLSVALVIFSLTYVCVRFNACL